MNNFTAPSVPTRTDGSHRPWTAHMTCAPARRQRTHHVGVDATNGRCL
jgi:hypothetical protein